MKKIISIALGVSILCSCSTYKYSARHINVDKQNITLSPTVVDVEVDYTKRITSTSHLCKTQSEAVQEAQYIAITDNNIDIVVDLMYKIEKKGLKYRATVTGFAGYYKNSRTLYEDIKLLKDIKTEDVEKYIILHNTEAIKYLNKKGDVINIYRNNNGTNLE